MTDWADKIANELKATATNIVTLVAIVDVILKVLCRPAGRREER